MVESALQQVQADLEALSFVASREEVAEALEALGRARRLVEVKLQLEAVRSRDAPPILVVAGGTNVGKSTCFNWVVGRELASAAPFGRHTKAPTVLSHTGEVASLGGEAFLAGYRRIENAGVDGATQEFEGGQAAYFLNRHEDGALRGVTLIDCPDIDSIHGRNREVALDLLYLADGVLFVTTPEKYNDEVCVAYLRRASDLDRTVLYMLNKGADPDVVDHVRDTQIPSLGGEVTLFTAPFVGGEGPDPHATDPHVRALREAVVRLPEDVRRRSLRGACIQAGRDLEVALQRARDEAEELRRVHEAIDHVLSQHQREYEAYLAAQEFYELNRVFERVLQYFRIPVLDTIYDGVRSAWSALRNSASRLISGQASRDPQRAQLEARRDSDRHKVKELIESARARVLEAPREQTRQLRRAADRWLQALEADGGIEGINRDVEEFLERAEAEAERWIERETQRQVELLEAHPMARNALRAAKGTLQVGVGVLGAHLTGGFGPWDLLIGTGMERATKLALENAGGYVHTQSLVAEFAKSRGALFHESLVRVVRGPLERRLPPASDPERLERLNTVAKTLSRGEAP